MNISIIALIISALALVANVTFSTLNASRDGKTDVKEQINEAKNDAAEKAAIRASLESIKSDTAETRVDMRSMKKDMDDFQNRLVVVEQSTKSAHHRIDLVDDKLELTHRD